MFEENKLRELIFENMGNVQLPRKNQTNGFERAHVGKFTRQSHGSDFYTSKTGGLKKKKMVFHGISWYFKTSKLWGAAIHCKQQKRTALNKNQQWEVEQPKNRV